MKKVLIVYAPKKDLEDIAQGLKKGFESVGAQVDIEEAGRRERPLSLSKYDLALFGSPVLGFLGGKIDNSIGEFLKDCKGTTGQKATAFVNSSLFGSRKSLKKLMKELEVKGCMVHDFRTFKNADAAKKYADKINLEN